MILSIEKERPRGMGEVPQLDLNCTRKAPSSSPRDKKYFSPYHVRINLYWPTVFNVKTKQNENNPILDFS